MTTAVTNEFKPAFGLLNIDSAAEYVGVSRRTIEREFRKGNLPVVRIGHRTVRIRTDHLEAWIAERTSQPASQV